MKTKLLYDQDGERTFALIFDHGDKVMEPLLDFLAEESINGARLSGIGGLESVTLGYFNWESKEYEHHQIDEQVELLSLAGDVAEKDGEPKVHAHVVVGRSDTSTRGGHLVDATARPTLELILEETPGHLRRRIDEETGLALIAADL